MKNLRVKKIISAVLVTMFPLMLFTGCNNKTKTLNTEVKGYFWKASKDGKDIYLGGTMHPSPTNVNYLNDSFKTIIENTDAIAVEIDLNDEKVVKEVQEKSGQLMYQENGELEKQLEPKEIENLKLLCKELGIDYKSTTNFTSYGIFMLLNNTIMQKLNYTGEICDVIWAKEYKKENKLVSQLETADSQIAVLGEGYELKDLKKLLGEYNNNILELNKTVTDSVFKAFEKSEMEYPEKHIKEMKVDDEEYYHKLITERNQGMVDKIEGYINGDKKYFVTAGYLHFVGEDSIIEMLKSKGYEIEKI